MNTFLSVSDERKSAVCALLSRYEKASSDEDFMHCALELAKLGGSVGEVPIGAVLVRDGILLAGDFNGREETKNALYHAEMSVISQGCARLGGWRLPGCTLYVTVEPCPMCAGAVWNARIPRVVIAAKDARAGALGSLLNLNSYPLNWKPRVTFGVCEAEARELMQTFFQARRK